MSNLNSFVGGIRLARTALEKLPAEAPIEKIKAPDRVEIAFPKPSKTALTKGSYIMAGGLLSLPEEKQPTHSSVSGKVIELKLDEEGNALSVIIENDKKDTLDPEILPFSKKLTATTPDEILEIIRRAGICESGDGISVARRIECALGGARRLIVNCTECEPFLSARRRLLIERPAEVLNGAKILLRALEVGFADIVADDSHIGAIRALEDAIGDNPLLRLRVTGAKYPQGDKRLMVNAVTGKEPPVRETTSQLGYVVFTAETCAAIFRAFADGMPQIRKTVTVAGDCIKTQKVLDVPIGTPLSDIVDFCGGTVKDPTRIICGGMMSGRALADCDYCVSKSDTAFLFLSEEYIKPKKSSDCIRCGKCVANCPMHLMPLYLAKQSKKGNVKNALAMGLKSCIECGTCTYNCPSGVEHVYYIREAKVAYNAERAKEENDV